VDLLGPGRTLTPAGPGSVSDHRRIIRAKGIIQYQDGRARRGTGRTALPA
jgi:hypothetical protein